MTIFLPCARGCPLVAHPVITIQRKRNFHSYAPKAACQHEDALNGQTARQQVHTPQEPATPRKRTKSLPGQLGSKGYDQAPHASKPASASQRQVRPRSRKPPSLPDQMLGVDYGTKWTGLALGRKGVCMELEVMPNDVSNRGMFARQVLQTAVDNQASGILVGLPLDPYNPRSTLCNPDADSNHGRKCRYFAHSLAMVARPLGIQVYLYDESETSSDALSIIGLEGRAKQEGLGSTRERLEKKVDSLSAFLLLRKFYEAPGRAMRVVLQGTS